MPGFAGDTDIRALNKIKDSIEDLNKNVKELTEYTKTLKFYSDRLDSLTIILVLITGILLGINVPIMVNSVLDIGSKSGLIASIATEIIGLASGSVFAVVLIIYIIKYKRT